MFTLVYNYFSLPCFEIDMENLTESITSTKLLIVILVVAVTSLILQRWLNKYPPGPWTLPVIGSLHYLSRKTHLDLARIAKSYGPVFTVWLGSRPVVVVSSLELAQEIVHKKASDFAERSMDTAGYTIFSQDKSDLISRSYDNKLSIMRKIAFSVMKTQSTVGLSIQEIVKRNVSLFIHKLKTKEGELVDPDIAMNIHITNTLATTLLNLQFKDENDPNYLTWSEYMEMSRSAIRKSALIDMFPLVYYIHPGLKTTILKAVEFTSDYLGEQLNQHEQTYKEGTVRDVTDVMLQCNQHSSESQQLSRTNLIHLISDLFVAGTRTTIDTVLWCLVALLRRPDVQAKIHHELDRYNSSQGEHEVIRMEGSCSEGLETASLIDLSSRHRLPYLNAFIYETMRRCPTVPVVPRKARVGTSIGNYLLSAGTAVSINVFAVHTDPKLWHDPLRLIPERFLKADGSFDSDQTKKFLNFGGGLRSCIGENLARTTVFLFLVNLLKNFQLTCNSIDEIPTFEDGTLALAFKPHSFKMMFNLKS